MNSLSDLISAGTSFISFIISTLGTLSAEWFVFVPMIIAISSNALGSAKGLLFFRRRRRR